MKDIDRQFKRFLLQGYSIIIMLTVIALVVMKVFMMSQIQNPLIVSVVFAIVVESIDGLVWRKVAKGSPDSLPTFFMSVSGIRMLSAIAVMFVYYLVMKSDSMMTFFVVFIVYYFALLAHHTIFFAKDRTT